MARRLAGQGRADRSTRPTVVVFAGNHGVVAQGVSPYPASVTAQMLENFSAGGARSTRSAPTYGAGLKVFELALDMPTRDITEAPAMDERECAATIAFGMEAIAGGADLLALGEMGIGNTTDRGGHLSRALWRRGADWVGRGTGVNDEGLARKIDAVRRAVALHQEHLDDPFEVLRRLGGREIAAMAGAILAARMEHTPVLLDGYVVCAAAAILHALDPASIDHCVAGHVSAEGAHAAGAGTPRQEAAARPRHAARRRLRRGAGHRPRQGGAGLPHGHGDFSPRRASTTRKPEAFRGRFCESESENGSAGRVLSREICS